MCSVSHVSYYMLNGLTQLVTCDLFAESPGL